MYISSFHIDGFGIFSNVNVEDIPPGLSIFLGRNEAGKSTCLEFLRVMLTGYPEGKNREFRDKYEPLASVQPGGTMVLCCETPQGSLDKIYLSRRPNRNGGLTLRGDSGEIIEEARLAAIFSGISQDVYRMVFGFSLGELESFESLSEEGVKNALYGASFGPGLKSPAEALKIIRRRKDEIFKPAGARMPLNVALKEQEALRAKLAEWNENCASYDTLCQSRDARKAELSQLRTTRESLEREQRALERRLGVWQQWDQWRQISIRLAALGEEKAGFPEDGIKRFDQIHASMDACEQELASERKKLDSLLERRKALVADTAILEQAPLLQRLAERKSGYRQALGQLESLREGCHRAETELAESLSMLGPGWDCDRIRSTDRSLFAREALDRHEEEINNALLTWQAASDGLTQSNNEVAACETSFAAATTALEELPEPEAILTGPERDELRQNMARLEESRRLEAGRQKTLQSARNALSRALEQARIQVRSDCEPDEAKLVLDKLRLSHDEAQVVASELEEHRKEARELESRISQLEENSENVKKKMDSLMAAARNEPGSTRDALDKRTHALRSLRSLANRIATSRERLQELEARLANEPKPAKSINWTLLVIGILFLLCGGALFFVNYFWGITTLSIPDAPEVPINLLEVYIIIACGVILLAFGVPSNRSEERRYQREIAQLQANREGCVMRMVDLDTQAKQLCAAAGVSDMDPITLDATEMLLERDKEQYIHDERSWKEIEILQRELADNHLKIAELRQKSHQKENDIQNCRRKWQSLMDGLHIADCPSPESAATVFARAEAARIACDNVVNAQTELDALWEDLHLLESSISSMPVIASRLENAPVPMSLEEAVAQTLETCRHADLVWEQRVRAQAALKTVENELERARKRQEESAQRHREATLALEQARKAWSEKIKHFGLGENLDPQTMRDALQFMENCLSAEEKTVRTQSELAQCEKELAALASPLQKCVAALGREPATEVDENHDWLATLDSLLADASANSDIINEQKNLDAQITAMNEEIGARTAALDTIKARAAALLANAGASNDDEFLRLARLHEERQDLGRTIASLETALKLAAGAEPLEDFLASFDASGQDAQESRLAELNAKLEEIINREQETATSVGNLEARVQNLAQTEDVDKLRQEEAMLQASIEKMMLEWCGNAFAEAILLKAKHKFESERQPEVIRLASEIFSKITNDRWKGLRTTLEDSRLEILPAHGEPVAPYKLSRGAQEQAYLALRLAYIRNHAAHAIPLPVIMDEILVNFDPERAERTARAFAGLARQNVGEPAQQIFYFTCQPHMVDILRSAAPDAKLFVVENRNISAA